MRNGENIGTFFVLNTVHPHGAVRGGWIRSARVRSLQEEGEEADYGKYTSGSGWRARARRRCCVQVVGRAWKLHYSWS